MSHSRRFSQRGSDCVFTVGGGASRLGTPHGQNTALAYGTPRCSAIDDPAI